MRLPLLSIICACGAYAAEPKIEVFPESITHTNTAQFDDQGRYRKSNSELRLQLQIKPPAGMQIASSQGVQLTEAVSDTGESLIPKDRNNRTGEETFNEYERERNDYDVNLNLANPLKPISEISKISGTLTLAIATGASKQAKLAPISEWLGKSVEIEAIHEEILVERKSGIVIRGSRSLFDRIQKITFFDGAGQEVRSSGWGGSSNNDEYQRTYQVTLPDDGSITMVFLPDLTEVAIPFTFTKLPLKSQAPDKKPGATKLPVTDVDTAKPEGPGKKPAKATAEGVKDPGAKAGGF